MKTIVVADKVLKSNPSNDNIEWIRADEYISSADIMQKRVKVINICSSYQYQQIGYYVSLLAEARGHKILPSTSTMMDVKLPQLIKGDAQNFDQAIHTALAKTTEDRVEIRVYFGWSQNPAFQKISELLFQLYQMPVLQARFDKKDIWQLTSLKALNIRELNQAEKDALMIGLDTFLSGKSSTPRSVTRKKYDLAILVNPEEASPPSDRVAIKKFIRAAEKIGFNTELISKADFNRISQFDALFIRETTNVNHHTFRMARRADFEGLAVIDDPQSILKCTNKIYLNELLNTNGIPTPKSVTFPKGKKPDQLEFPFVLKLPDGAFSKGVKKVNNEAELDDCMKSFFQQTDLLIAQEFLPTPFDWRVGILNNQPIYVCKYYMAPKHWQIVDWRKNNTTRLGKSETFAIPDAPPKLLKTAIKAAKLIGTGLYGIDIKEIDGKFYVIEINDNPSIDSGIEDKVAKNQLYENIMQHLMKLAQAN